MEESEVIILLVIVIFALVIGGIYYEFYYRENESCDEEILAEAYVNGTKDVAEYISFQIINQSNHCNQIPVEWIDQNNQIYSENLISINCLKGGNQNE